MSIHVTDRTEFRSYEFTVRLIDWCQRRHPDEFRFNPPPYEYEHRLAPIDIISGSSVLRESIRAGSDVAGAINVDVADWWATVAPDRLY